MIPRMPMNEGPRGAAALRIANGYAALPGVTAVAMAGSQATAIADGGSDLDLYVYPTEEIPMAVRTAMAQGSPRKEIGNDAFGPGDEWIDAASGIHIDVMFRDQRWIEDELDRVLVRHEARVGYSTAFWHSIRASASLFDRSGWYAHLIERAAAPYPEPLVRAIVAKNQPLLRRNLSSFHHQLDRAVARVDHVSVNHRVAAFLASAFDVLFALNRVPHPGEKRLLRFAEALCPKRPPELAKDVEALLASVAMPGPDLLRRADVLAEQIDVLLRREGLL
jgi:hypothetical protein